MGLISVSISVVSKCRGNDDVLTSSMDAEVGFECLFCTSSWLSSGMMMIESLWFGGD